MVRTRIPPSPTGHDLHVGNLYTALINWAYAHKNKGQFIVRIEDTDRTRFVEGAAEQILKTLRDYGLEPDEDMIKGGPYGPYIQSQRLPLYKKYAEQLIEQGDAYYCFCSAERLAEVREKARLAKQQPKYDRFCLTLSKDEIAHKLKDNVPHVIRLKVPEGTTTYHDVIHGDITIKNEIIDDQILIKSDGYPTYHMGVVVDDHLMKITHIIRAEEWMPSVPKHVILYNALKWELPVFCHVPLLRTPDKGKISKRKNAVWARWYLEQGYLPEVVLNYLALMAWSHPEEKEIFSIDEYLRVFDLKDIKPVGPVFDIVKLEWMNGEYIRKMTAGELLDRLMAFIGNSYPKVLVAQTIPLVQERIKKFSDYLPLTEFFFTKPVNYEVDLSNKKAMLKAVAESLNQINDWKAEDIGEAMQETAKNLNMKNSEFFMLLRVAITGKKISPPLNESMEILGKNECIERVTM